LKILQEHVEMLKERLLRVEKLASAGMASAGVAHELRNPLAVIATSLFILEERVAQDDRALHHVRRIAAQVSTATEIANNLLDVVRERPFESVSVDLAGVVRDALKRLPAVSGIRLEENLPTNIALVRGDSRRLTQVMVNVIANALQAMARIPERVPCLTIAVAREDTHAMVMVSDNGPGIPDLVMKLLFDPLFTTRTEGTGLGLALSQAIAVAHGGELTATNTPRGTCFTLRIPREP
jgi:two-component system, NtrC family, sensor histidine kinase HydH